MSLSTTLSSKTQESFPLSTHILLVSHSFFQWGEEITSTLVVLFFWGNEAAGQTNPQETAPRQMLYYPSRQRQQRTDNSLYNAIISTFKAMLEYPMPHFIQPWNFQHSRLFSILPWGYVLPPYMIKWPLQLWRETKPSQIREVSRKS